MKLLLELTYEELENLYEKNNKLREMASENAQENESFWIDEYMSAFRNLRGVSWNIGYPGNYMNVNSYAYKDFLEAAQDVQKDYGLFEEETARKIEKALAKVDLYEDASAGYYDMSDENFSRLEKWLESMIDDIGSELVNTCGEMIDFSYTDAAAKDALDCLVENIGDKYETDGIYLYETERRRYA